MEFLNELKRSKLEQHACKAVYNNFKEREVVCPTGPSGGPGGGSWWWIESGDEQIIFDGE